MKEEELMRLWDQVSKEVMKSTIVDLEATYIGPDQELLGRTARIKYQLLAVTCHAEFDGTWAEYSVEHFRVMK